MTDADPLADPAYRAALVDLLGVLAYGEIAAFERLAADAAMAPTTNDKAALARLAVNEYHHYEELRDRLASLEVDPVAAMEPFRAALDAFHDQTAPSTWLEGLVKAYVGDGIAADFYREIANLLDEENASLVCRVVEDLGQNEFVVNTVRRAISEEPRLAGRLALWGRRLMGEALTQAQRVVGERESFDALFLGGEGREGLGLGGVARLFTVITEQHTERMKALGLAP
jgi:hypothetical protein